MNKVWHVFIHYARKNFQVTQLFLRERSRKEGEKYFLREKLWKEGKANIPFDIGGQGDSIGKSGIGQHILI